MENKVENKKHKVKLNEWDTKLKIIDQQQKLNILSKQQIIIIKQQEIIITSLKSLEDFNEKESMCMFKCIIS